MTIVTLQLRHLVVLRERVEADRAESFLVVLDDRRRHVGEITHREVVKCALSLLAPVLSDTLLHLLITLHEGVLVVVHVSELPLTCRKLTHALGEARHDTDGDWKSEDV